MFDVIVVGGGHAGVEAAAGACRMGAKVALVTFDLANLGALSCNPSIGGVGKGHLVREIDALDGLAALAADASAIHYRMLNRSKGRAVQGPRVQVDRAVFSNVIPAELGRLSNVAVVTGEVAALHLDGDVVSGVELRDGSLIGGRSVVLATGTFLRSRMFRGEKQQTGGRTGERSSTLLGEQLAVVGHTSGRLKTGTPPRLDGRTIDWSRITWQPSDTEAWTMSPLGRRTLPQIACAVTATNPTTHAIIANNLTRSPMRTGAIVGEGPRYCPSIEDKVARFGDRDAHQIFLEPESLSGATVYPNGISTSLPVDTQEAMLRSIVGLERVAVTQWGYAVEYDHLDPRGLDHTLQSRAIAGLFCAGQINGTTGYEEAAAQGLVAGVNAAAHAFSSAPLSLNRTNSYIGVLIDDLVLQGVSEPYRMLTARAEYRLTLRSDNAVSRLTPVGVAVGCIGERRLAFAEQWQEQRRSVQAEFDRKLTPSSLMKMGVEVAQDGVVRTAGEWLRFPQVGLAQLGLELDNVAAEVMDEAAEDARYAPYLERQAAEIRDVREQEEIGLPLSLDYRSIAGMSNEMVERLEAARPPSLGAASRVRGVTPAALTALLLHVRRTS